ncbi:molecular chaperone [Burkholderia sp. Z1]|uniref:fimbrial biogenesis chaperone n=1 Tax=Burkholderia sp. Z1 TaxID=2759039 RepID=UPI0018675E9E|nr:molecular chaperone [Burkholderia sp. Z1]
MTNRFGKATDSACVFARLAASCLLLLILWQSNAVHAALSFDGLSRFVMDEGSGRKQIDIVNDGADPVLVQVSIEWGDLLEGKELPLAVSNPLMLIPASGRKSIYVFYQGTSLPKERESYFVLSVLEIPQRPTAPNTLQVAFRHHLKFFYRPRLNIGLPEAVDKLDWKTIRDKHPTRVKVRNDSPYYLTLTDVDLKSESGEVCSNAVAHLMLQPFSSHLVEEGACSNSLAEVSYYYVGDSGMTFHRTSRLQPEDRSRGALEDQNDSQRGNQ